MPKLSQRWEILGRPLPIYWTPAHQRYCANSVFWFCYQCGKRYAEVRSWIDDRPAIWRSVAGVCPDCPGNRWSIPGSLEVLTFVGWGEVPEEILRHQLRCELSFLDSPEHPHNQGALCA